MKMNYQVAVTQLANKSLSQEVYLTNQIAFCLVFQQHYEGQRQIINSLSVNVQIINLEINFKANLLTIYLQLIHFQWLCKFDRIRF